MRLSNLKGMYLLNRYLCHGALLFLVAALPALAAQSGLATWYGESHRGKPMANTKPFDPDAYTCASWYYPLGTVLVVKSGTLYTVVTVTDRGPNKRLIKKDGRVIDLSRAAFKQLAPLRVGKTKVEIEILK